MAKGALAALAATSLSACVASGSRDTVTHISKSDSRIEFGDPAAKSMKVRHFELISANGSYTGFSAQWRVDYAAFPQARASYLKLSPGLMFTNDFSVSDYIDSLNFGDIETTSATSGPTSSNYGKLDRYILFQVGQSPCIAFASSMGAGWFGGNGRITGHYCGPNQADLSPDRLQEIAATISVRKRPPRRGNANQDRADTGAGTGSDKVRAAIHIHWPMQGADVKGIMIRESANTRRGQFWFPMPGSKAECSGKWHTGARQSTGRTGTWDLLCTNGVAAKGQHRSNTLIPEYFEGTDARGHPLLISLTPTQ